MNKTYRNIWNAATGTWTAVAETAKSHSKGSARAARQAVVALALGSAGIGGAFAADACTTADGENGALDAGGVCKVSSAGTTGKTISGGIGTMATSDELTNFLKFGAGGGSAAEATGGSSMALGGNTRAEGGYSVAIGGATTIDANGGRGAYAKGSNSVSIGVVSEARADNSVALGASTLADRANTVSVGAANNRDGRSFTRQIVNMAAGTETNDAVNVSQLTPVVAALGGNASIDKVTGVVTGPTYNLANGGQQTTVAGAFNGLDKALTTANGNITQNTADITTINNKLATAVTDDYIKIQSTAAGASTSALNAIAIGSATSASGAGDVALGVNANAAGGGISATALGANASATGSGVVAIGGNARATGAGSVTMGLNANAGEAGSIAIGQRAVVNTGATNSIAFGNGATIGANVTNSVALGANSTTTRNDAVAVGSTTGARQIVNMAAGTQATDAVNVSQLTPVVEALGGGALINSTTGAVTGPTYNLANGGTQTTVGDALEGLDQALTTANGNIAKNTSDISDINDQLGDLSSGKLGLVQQSAPGADITVGANTDGAAVDFAGTAGARKLTGVAAGDVSATSADAVNGSQLHGVSGSVASAIGAGSTVNPDGSISAPSFTVGDGNGGSKVVHNVGDVVENLDGRVTTNEGDIKQLADQIGNGTVGLVQQDATTRDITVARNTDGAAVDFTGTAGARKLTGVAAGDVSATSADAVNGSQLHGVSGSVASAIGAGSTVNPDGSISAPSFTVGDGNGGSKVVHNVGDVVDNLDGRVTTNEGSITTINQQLASGQIGLVQQDQTTGAITVAANTGGTSVSFAGIGDSPRTLTGVANGVKDDDAVTIAQLKATGLIDYTGKELGAVVYDGIDLDHVTFGGSGGTRLHNVAPGLIASGSMDAVNGGQLYALQQDFANQFAGLGDRVSNLEAGGGSGGPGNGSGNGMGPGTGTGGDGSLVVGNGSDASGENSSAVGQGAVASGDNGSAFGQGSVASGSGSSAIGQGSVASGENSTAIGQGSSATAGNSVALGQGSVADREGTVSVGSADQQRQITNVAEGTAQTDAVNVGQLERRIGDTNRMINDVAKNAYAGVAAAMAMPNMTPSQPGKTVVAAGAANYKSGSAVAAGATYRSRNGKWLVNGAVSVTSTGDAGVRTQVGYEF
ncbi:ESPR-type extended signal peptide-containing protein [Burkholderia sp. BE12]|uniref:ESPR-type extended signal peptide-containing protein n=1 Tax=Burkholderia sp. BE12 TaxID=2082394 RepID=UPI000CF41EAE|nr:ESPR-type extended signal peptide-containing protein [Burkholderia sp. BE12]